jgi:transcriptional regulator with XRE-family HTH domain
MVERLKRVRKMLGLKQKTFAEKVGLSQSHYSWVERGRLALTDRNIKIICKVFNVNEQWLRTGNGSIFLEPSSKTPIGDMTPEEAALVEMFGKLEPKTRALVMGYINDMWELQQLREMKDKR